MKTQIDTAALIAEFQARGGSVTRVDMGVRAIERDSTIYKAMREGKKAVADGVRIAEEAEDRWHRQVDYYNELRHNGVGRDRAHALSQDPEVL